jgi:putative ATP-dependent endonuclease of the OLD family
VAAHAEADGEDGVDGVEVQRASHVAETLSANLKVLLTSCVGEQLAVGVQLTEVLRDLLRGRLEQLGHLGLREPERLALEPALDATDKQRLQSLQHIDPSFAEVFFGSYPVLVEGDTEHAAFLAAIVEEGDALRDRVTVVRARGKAILVSLVKVLHHFAIPFGVVHDADWPLTTKATKNGSWKLNAQIHEAIERARGAGLHVRHRVSVPDFERYLDGEEESKDKPITAYRRVRDDGQLRRRVRTLMAELIDGANHDCYPRAAVGDDVLLLQHLEEKVKAWAREKGDDTDKRRAGLSA